MFLYLIRHAFRLLRREPAFTLAAVMTLALGVGANVAVFAVVEAVLLRPFPYPEAGRLVILNHRDRRTGITKEFIAIGDYVDLAQRQTSFQSLSAYGGGQATVFGFGEPFRATALSAGPGLMGTLGVQPVLGRGLGAEDSRPGAAPVMLLGYDLWQTHFGSDPHVVGRGVKVGQVERQVVGVGPPGFHFPPNARTELILPETLPLQAPAERKSGWTFAVARLKPGASFEEAGANLASASRQMEQEYPRSNLGSEYFAVPLRDALVGNTKPALVLMLAAVGVVLLIACANVANLLLARSLARRREMALRVALGAGRLRLVAQLLTESLALAAVAGIAGILIAQWGAHALVALVPKSVSVPGIADVRINGGVLAFALGITVATALVFGVMSALTVRTADTSGALVASGRVSLGAQSRRMASALVAVEVAFAIVLLIGAGLILRSFSRLLALDPGFRGERVMTMDIQMPADRYRDAPARRALYDRVFGGLQALPQVQAAGAAVVVPLTGNNWTVPLERPERPLAPGERPPEVGWQVASGGYFQAMQIPLLAGRLFDRRDGQGAHSVIVSEAVQKQYFPNERTLGREIKTGDARWEIVGIVGNIRRAGLRDEPRADLYFPFERDPSNQITLFIRTSSDPLEALPSMQTALRSIEPNIVFVESQTMAGIAKESMQVTHLAVWLLGIFAATALALAAVGIYSVMAYVVRQRTREIGTRVALGATRGDIAWLVMRQGIEIAAFGTVIGLAAGLVAARSLASILYGISTSDPVTLGVSAAVLVVTTMVACYLPARRAALIDPARTLAEQ
ncbi:MAG TPA: ABC transporter permease [Bryobacteraceae bacterium]|jgi:predicted permease|nr:ABC transporter permease [Bryobacteraceae bacterium]